LSLLSLACISSLSLDLPGLIICRPPNDRPLRMWKFKIMKNALAIHWPTKIVQLLPDEV
ncbi:hypothetical protein BDR05DRAFT_955000, partial [Suillus weaverae]